MLVQLNWKIAAMAATGATALVGWVAAPPRVSPRVASATPPRVIVTPPPAVRVPRLPVRPLSVPVGVPTVSSQRNLFRFPAAPGRRVVEATAPTPEPVVSIPQRAPVPFQLSGVARGVDTSGQDQWTAVLSGGTDGISLVRVGDVVGERYRVARLSAESVTLVDVRDGHESTLALGQRP